MNTVRIKASQIYKDWHVIDAAGRPLGRVATEAAILLRGKHKPTYEPHLDDGDFVIIVNASKVRVTGRKSEQIKYYSHSGYPGGLKTRTYEKQLELFPERILEKAVWGMLPGGPLGKAMMRHLKVYKGPEHPHASQIAGSEKARAARAVAPNAFARPATPPRLRPLTVPAGQVEATPVPEAVVEPPKPKAAPPRAAAPAKPKPETAEAPAAKTPARKTTRKKAEAPEATAPAVEAAQDVAALPDAAVPEPAEKAAAPKKRAPRKKAEAAEAPSDTAASTGEAPKKPARRRAARQED